MAAHLVASAEVEGGDVGELLHKVEGHAGALLPDLRVAPGADVGVDADHLEAGLVGDGASLLEPLVPDAERRRRPADVRLSGTLREESELLFVSSGRVTAAAAVV